jgi:hypothetical protein
MCFVIFNNKGKILFYYLHCRSSIFYRKLNPLHVLASYLSYSSLIYQPFSSPFIQNTVISRKSSPSPVISPCSCVATLSFHICPAIVISKIYAHVFTRSLIHGCFFFLSPPLSFFLIRSEAVGYFTCPSPLSDVAAYCSLRVPSPSSPMPRSSKPELPLLGRGRRRFPRSHPLGHP